MEPRAHKSVSTRDGKRIRRRPTFDGRPSIITNVSGAPWHPVLIASTFVLGQYLDLLLHPADLVRPLVLTIAVTLAFLVAATLVLRSGDRGALLTTALILALLSKPLAEATFVLIGRMPIVAVVFVGAGGLLVAIGLRVLAKRLAGLGALTRALNTFAVLFSLVVVAGAVPTGFPTALAPDLVGRPSNALPLSGDPDIYIVLLDAYPGAGTLERVFEFDNGEFLSALENRGLEVADRSRANYWFTSLTLASLFHMQPVTDVPALSAIIDGRTAPNPQWRQALNDAPAFDILRNRGYRITSIASGWADVAVRSVDTFVDGGQLNDFETHLLRATFTGNLIERVHPQYFVHQQRSRIDSVFDAVIEVSSANSVRPRFVFAHVPAPHPPISVTADGGYAQWSDADSFFGITTSQMGISVDEYERRFLGQLRYVNRRALEVVDAIVEADEDAIVVVMSDHGPGNPGDGLDLDEVDALARLSNLLAIRHPGRDALLPDDASPVNLLPALFNAYFGTELPYHANTSFRSTVFGTDEKYRELKSIPESELSHP